MVNATSIIITWRTWHNVLSPGKYMWRQGLDMVLASSVQMTEPAHHKRLTSLHRHFTSRQRPTRNLGWNTPPAIGTSSLTNIRCLRGVYETIKGCPKGSSTLAKKFCTALAMAFPDFFGRGESTCRCLNSAHWKGPQYKGTIRTGVTKPFLQISNKGSILPWYQEEKVSGGWKATRFQTLTLVEPSKVSQPMQVSFET